MLKGQIFSSSHFASCRKIYSQALKVTFALALLAFSKIINILLILLTSGLVHGIVCYNKPISYTVSQVDKFFGLHSAPMHHAELEHACAVNSQKKSTMLSLTQASSSYPKNLHADLTTEFNGYKHMFYIGGACGRCSSCFTLQSYCLVYTWCMSRSTCLPNFRFLAKAVQKLLMRNNDSIYCLLQIPEMMEHPDEVKVYYFLISFITIVMAT